MTLTPRLPTIITTSIVFVIALTPLMAVFDGIGWFIRLTTAVVAAAAVTTVVETGRPDRRFPILSVAIAGGAVLWTLIVIHGSAFASDPISTSVWSRVGEGFFGGWSELLASDRATADLDAAETLVGVLLWVGVATALHVSARWRSPLGALLATALLLFVTAAAALSVDSSDVLAGAAVGAAGLLVVAAVSQTEVDHWGVTRLVGLVATVAVAGLIGAGVVAVTDSLQRDPVDPRQARDTTAQTLEVPDLLSEFGARASDPQAVFSIERVLGDPDVPVRFRLLTYGAHDGRRFLPIAEYVQVTRLSQPAQQVAGEQFVIDVQLRNLDEPFVPMLDRTLRSDIPNLGWDAETQTAARDNRPVTYQVTGVALDPADLGDRNVDRLGVDPVYLEVPENIPASFRTAALNVAADAPDDRAAVEAIVGLVAGLGRDRTVASGHALGRLETDLVDGNAASAEQLASIQTLLLRSAGIPARPVVGYVATDETVPGTAIDVWVEVPYAESGWTPTESVDPVAEPPAVIEEQVTTTTVPGEQDVAAQAQPRELGPSADSLTPSDSGSGLSLRDLGLIAVGLLIVMAIGLIVARLVRRSRRRHRPTGDLRTLGAWAELVDRLREAGLRAGSATTVDDVVELTADIETAARPAAESLGRRASAVFHSPWETSDEEADAAWDELEEIESLLRARQGPRFHVQRVADPRVLRHRAPEPPPSRDGGRRSVYSTLD
ncbi:MAG: transglutaminase-like domain-containing protein [Actinomycetota bacterium]